ncbi:MAG: 2-C-methyl-D-erythritol 4-phosphate cytidylyltransferase [Planctomycetota bacterium]
MSPFPDPPRPGARAVIVAAGRSTRMGEGGVRKPFLDLDGRTLLEVGCAAFAAAQEVAEIVLVVHPSDRARAEALVAARPAFARVTAVVEGGEERIDSVRAGVGAGETRAALVAIHDAARPLVAPATIDRAIRAATTGGASLVAVAVRDTVKHAPDGRAARTTLDRAGLWLAQTPQCFDRARFLDVLARAKREGFRPTDDAALWERYIGPVVLVEGDPANLKITTPADLALARALLAARAGGGRSE